MVRIADPEKSRAFYEPLRSTFGREMDIVRGGEKEATNYLFSLGGQESVLELTFNHDGRTYDLGTAYGHIAIGVDGLDATLARLGEQGIEPEKPPYQVREVGWFLCFVRDSDGYLRLQSNPAPKSSICRDFTRAARGRSRGGASRNRCVRAFFGPPASVSK